ncbi:hydroxyacid dehydrogenase [Candidatus Woesearchaeota archaeon]|jgi:D-lactate dehydrogenase|nr:hydroxyacid dehydrogenase [Candidatus Woesearchaeota archaeon]MBT4387662.1 hydroxyacid dehydrogenase [Candidatus Woesearchaeota archaeon]MBT4595975.1 hydroxyacid dehydrogenase [Candidatus Woesearchaeota archaeon]MBT5741105.1 hydroxyacid dehydrogenase [Candidatus Woesearchaeota archaeon]MBT6505370.1 hydroxyacid dehydrogenase [Candidatus Woesearchaeota archaeon]
MKKLKIAFFGLKDNEQNYFKKKLKQFTLKFFNESISLDNVSKIKNFDIISIFINCKVDKKILRQLPNLKLITTRSTGYDHIDIKECKKRKITVCNVPIYGENTVAEHTFALILSLSRNVHKSYIRSLKCDYSIDGLQGFDLRNKTIGVIGAGHIGHHVIKIAHGFGMDILVNDSHPDNFLLEVFDFKFVKLNELLKKSDIITIHCPLNKNTKHLINKQNMKLVKKGAILINTSRGGIVSTDALIYGLNKKILSGVALDVIEGEQLIKEEKELLHDNTSNLALKELLKDHDLLSRNNVVYTPHIAFYSKEAVERIDNATIENILGFVNKNNINIID